MTIARRIGRVVAIVATGAIVAAAAPSRDCRRQHGPVEQAICADHSLGQLDQALARIYAKALARPHANEETLTRKQMNWLEYRDAACALDPIPILGNGPLTTSPSWRTVCLSQLYHRRISALEAQTVNDGSIASDADTPCYALMKFLPPPGTIVDGDAASIIAKRAGKTFVIDSSLNEGLSIKYLDDNAGDCPAIRLYQNTQAGRVAVKLPNGSGSYCGNIPINEWPSFSIAEISGTQALLARSGSSLEVTRRAPSGWGPSCSIDLTLVTAYSVSKALCQEAQCAFLEQIAPHLAEFVTRGDGSQPTPGLVALWNAEAPPSDEQRWEAMRRIGLATLRRAPFVGSGKEADGLLTYFDDQNGTQYSSYNGIVVTPGEVTAFVSIKFRNELLLGKIGAEGFGCCHVSETELLSVYRLTADKLEPIAGLVLEPRGYRLAFDDER